MDDRAARRLFDVSPSAYVDERARIVKELRSAGHKDAARSIAALKRPTLAMWAVVAAGDDSEMVRSLFRATDAVADAQASGDRDATMTATRTRKAIVSDVTSAAVDALRRHEPSAEVRRPEIRTLVLELSRHPGLADAWIAGTLREPPELADDEMFGFEAFAGRRLATTDVRSDLVEAASDVGVQAESPRPSAVRARPRTLRSVPAAPPDDRSLRDPQQERAERAERAARSAERRDAIRARDRAASALVSAAKRLAGARELFDQAQAELRAAEDNHASAAARHATAVDRVERFAES